MVLMWFWVRWREFIYLVRQGIQSLMMNCYKQTDLRNKTKSMFPVNKSHIASMHLRTNLEASPHQHQRQPLKNTTNRMMEEQQKPRSSHKYKKSLILQDNTIQLVKKNSDLCPKNAEMSTQRMSKERRHKQSIDYAGMRVKTEMDEAKRPTQTGIVEISVDELREMVHKLRSLKGQKQILQRQLHLYKRQLKKQSISNSVLLALTNP